MPFSARKFQLTFVCLIICGCSVKALDLRKCADFDQNTDSEEFLSQNEIKPFLNVYDEYGTHQIKEMVDFYHQINSDELNESHPTEYRNHPTKYVVRFHRNKCE